MAEKKIDEKRFGKPITFKLLRFNPEKDDKPFYKSYQFILERGMTILDGLMHIKETQDSTLSYRKSCRMGICGSCAMFVNGLPLLTCQTQIAEINSDTIIVKPLPNYPIIKDLVPDLAPLFIKHQAIKPYIIRADTMEVNNPTGEFNQSPEELERYIQFSYCIKCGACISACPTCATDEEYLGPQALAQAYRYTVDTRDGGYKDRKEATDVPHGVWRCHFPGACSEACPKGVDPAFGLQLLKRKLIFGAKQKPSDLVVQPKDAKRWEDIPEAPPPTVKK